MLYGIIILIVLAGIFLAGALVYRKHAKESEELIKQLRKYVQRLHEESLKK